MGRRKRQRSSTGSRSSHGGIGSDRRSSHSVGSSTVQPAMLSLLIAALLGSQTTTHAFITLRQSHVGVIPRTASKRSSILIAKNKKQYYTNSQQEEVDQLQPFYQTSFSNSSLLPPLLELSNLPPSFYLPDDISTLTDSIKNGTSTPSSTTAASATNSSVTTTTTLLVKPSVKKRRSKPALEDVLKAQKQMKLSNRHSGGVQPSVEPTPQTSTASFTSRKRERKPQDSLDKFARDITTVLKELRPHGSDPTLPTLFRNINMPSFTNSWSQHDWDLHTSRWRYWKYIISFPTSRLVRRLAPQLALVVVWSCIACWLCSHDLAVHHKLLARAVLPLAPLSLVSTFVAGLLTLRSNQGLSRLNEGRLAFGKVVLYTRDMAQLIASIVYPRNRRLGLLAARHVALFAWLLKDFLRHYDENWTQPLLPYEAIVCHDEDLVRCMLPSATPATSSTATSTPTTPKIKSSLFSLKSKNSSQNDADNNGSKANRINNNNVEKLSSDARFLLHQRKKPVAICTRLRQIFAYMQVDMTTSEQSRLDACAQQLNQCIMVCERIRASPIPPLYTAHAGRLLMFYLFFLPLALRGSSLLNNVGTILTTTVVSYAMLGLDEISHILEEPFRLMPLYHLSKNSMKDVADALVCLPPSLDEEVSSLDDKDSDMDVYLQLKSENGEQCSRNFVQSYW